MSNDIETLLRDALRDEADTAVPWGSVTGGDPWSRIERAHRRSRNHRRAGLAGVLVAAAAATGVVMNLPQDRPPPPAGEPEKSDWRQLDDGRTRGSAVDATTREQVAAVLRTPCCGTESYTLKDGPETLRFLWNGRLGSRRGVLVRATLSGSDPADRRDTLSWVVESAPGRWQHGDQWDSGPAAVALPYADGAGGFRMVVIVRRDAPVSTWQPLIRANGVLEPRADRWQAVSVRDGVADFPIGDPRSYAGTEVRVMRPDGNLADYTSSAGWSFETFGLTPAPVTPAVVSAAVDGARGDLTRPGVKALAAAELESGLSDVEHGSPAILWAGVDGRGEAVVVSSSGYPGQGRLLRVRSWSDGGNGDVTYTTATTVAASPVHAVPKPVLWRVPVPAGQQQPSAHVVGWLLPAGSTDVRVEIDGAVSDAKTIDGLGTVEVHPRSLVRVFAHLPNGKDWHDSAVGGSGGAADPVDLPGRIDLFPPGPDQLDPS